jgi:hypothetical protein
VEVAGIQTPSQLVLLDADGNELARRTVGAGRQSVEITAPDVSVPTLFRFEAIFSQGQGSEMLVREITVTP